MPAQDEAAQELMRAEARQLSAALENEFGAGALVRFSERTVEQDASMEEIGRRMRGLVAETLGAI
jgi:hypothetical protein